MDKLRKSQRATKRRLRFEYNKARRILDARIDRKFLRNHPGHNGRYILRGKEPVPCPRLSRWVRWFENERGYVGRDEVDGILVSTVFLGLDHSLGFSGGRSPVLFETMVFGGAHDQEQFRYNTWDEARMGHVAIVETLRSQP